MKKDLTEAARQHLYGEVTESADDKDLMGNAPVTKQKRRIQDIEAEKQLKNDFDYLED